MGDFLDGVIEVFSFFGSLFGDSDEYSCGQAPSPPKRPRSQPDSQQKKIKRQPILHGFKAPEEKDLKLRTFSVVNPEGEVFPVNTAETSSPFYGPVWTRILDVYTKGDFVRGRVSSRMTSKDGRFSGYSVSVDGVPAFLPASKSGVFRNEENDATSRCIALKIQDVFTNGDRSGTIIVDAKEPYKVIEKELRKVHVGATFHALAMDVDANYLVFPSPGYKEICVPLSEARSVMQQAGCYSDDYFMTGLYWELVIMQKVNSSYMAIPTRVLA